MYPKKTPNVSQKSPEIWTEPFIIRFYDYFSKTLLFMARCLSETSQLFWRLKIHGNIFCISGNIMKTGKEHKYLQR